MAASPSIPVWTGVWVVLTYTSVIVHEAGHAIAALAVRTRIRSIEVGTKWRIAALRLGKVSVTFRLLPTRGATQVDTASSRSRRLLYTAGGLLANALLSAAGTIWFLMSSYSFIAFELVLVNMMFVIFNVWPRPANPPSRPLPSDGWVIHTLLFRPDALARPTPQEFVGDIVARIKRSQPPTTT